MEDTGLGGLRSTMFQKITIEIISTGKGRRERTYPLINDACQENIKGWDCF